MTGTPATVRDGSGTYVGISVLRDALVARGHEVELIAPESRVGAGARLWFNYRIRNAARAARPDVIVGFDLDGVFLDSAGALDVASIKGVVAEEMRFEKGFARASLRLQSWFEKRRVGRADRVLTTSRYAADGIARHYGIPAGTVRIVPELIDLRAWRKTLEAAPPAAREHASILCVAHLYPRKDVATLLGAMRLLQTRAVLRVIGNGPEFGRLCRLAKRLGLEDRVLFLNHLPLAELAEEYRRADLFCLPSRQEGFGIVLLEAMAAGLPIIAARAAAIPEVVGECGCLIEPGDVAGFARAIDDLLNDKAARQRLSEAGRRRVTRYDAPQVAEEFLSALDTP